MMSRRIACLLVPSLVLVALAGCKGIVTPDPRTELAPDLALVMVAPPPTAGRTQVASSGDGTAYVRATPDAADRHGSHLYVDRPGQTYMVMGLPYEKAQFADVRWSGPGQLTFDRWHSDHAGIRYLLDLYKGRLVRASAIRR